MLEDFVVKIEVLHKLVAEMEKYKFQSTTLHEIRTFTLAQRPTQPAPDRAKRVEKSKPSASKCSKSGAAGKA